LQREEINMSFDYDEIRHKKDTSGTQWAAYSDLFMVLAFVFLLMYMVASLRTGMASVTTHAKIEEIKQELEYYEAVKSQYLKEEASDQERKVYDNILSQMTLLENEAKSNKERLAQEYSEQENRESSLNQYQKMIKALVNANTIAKADASQRIASQKQQNQRLEQVINQKTSDLASLEGRLKMEVSEMSALQDTHYQQTRQLEKKFQELKDKHDNDKENLVSLNEMLKDEAAEKAALKRTHKQESRDLAGKFEELKNMHDDDQNQLASLKTKLRQEAEQTNALKYAHNEEKRKLERKLNRISDENSENLNAVASLENKLAREAERNENLKERLTAETDALDNKLRELNQVHNKNQRNIASLEKQLRRNQNEKSDLKNSYYDEKRDLENQLHNLINKDDQNQSIVASLEDKLQQKESEKEDLKGAYADVTNIMEDKLDKLRDKHAKSQRKLASLSDQNRDELAKLNSDLENTKNTLKHTTEDLGKARNDLASKERDLDDALKLEQKRRDIAKRIINNFKNHGISGEVNEKTGDVILDFGSNYFDTDSHKLKVGMESSIRKAIPVYADSLFGSDVLSSLISSVEIIGFASPTYAGKPVDPTILSAENRAAVNYNLDLSYKRAKSIFEFIFDKRKINFKYQDDMVHLINVAGRSFLTETMNSKESMGMSIEEFCGQYNCLKSQRVIIKFGLSERGRA